MKPRTNLLLNERHLYQPTLKRMLSFLFLAVLAVFLGVQPAKSADNRSAGGWQFMAEAYFWYASIGGESASGGDIQLDDNDLVDALNMGFMGTVGAKKGKWGFLVDTIYLDVSDNANNMVGGIGVNANVEQICSPG